jgi:hypothetical protein
VVTSSSERRALCPFVYLAPSIPRAHNFQAPFGVFGSRLPRIDLVRIGLVACQFLSIGYLGTGHGQRYGIDGPEC